MCPQQLALVRVGLTGHELPPKVQVHFHLLFINRLVYISYNLYIHCTHLNYMYSVTSKVPSSDGQRTAKKGKHSVWIVHMYMCNDIFCSCPSKESVPLR